MSELKSEIGKRMATIRKEAGDSQEVCAQKLGIKRGTYAAYEKGTNAAPDDIKRTFATKYNISLQYLISGHHLAEEPAGTYKKTSILDLLGKMEPSPLSELITQKVHQLIEENRSQKDKIIELLERLDKKKEG